MKLYGHKIPTIFTFIMPLSIGAFTAILYIFPTSNTLTSALTYQTESTMSFTFSPMISISVSSNTIDIPTLAPGTTAESDPITVTVGTNTAYGYSLYADVGNSTDYNTDSLVHKSNDNNSTSNNNSSANSTPSVFTSITTNASLSQLTTDNTWGYSFKPSNEATWSTYNGLPLYTTTEGHTSTTNPALLIDTKDPGDNTKSIDFKIAARASSTQPSGTYSNVINFYAVGKPEPPILYEEVAKMSKGVQTVEDFKTRLTAPTSINYREDTSNSGVYEYNESVFGESSDASNNYKIYYYRGILEPESDQGFYGSDGKATTYPNYVKLPNDTCWRIIRTTGSGGVKMIYNGIWSDSTCANVLHDTLVAETSYNHSTYDSGNISLVGYTFNKNMINKTGSYNVNSVFGSNSNYSINNTDSKAKQYVEDWYSATMADSTHHYTDLLEPSAGYCNDRTTYSDSLIPPTPLTSVSPYRPATDVYFGAYERYYFGTPSLACPRSTVDLYSTATATDGNRQLAYPVALLTADEVAFSAKNTSISSKNFLRTGVSSWLMSPDGRSQSSGTAYLLLMSRDGYATGAWGQFYEANGLRPVISLKSGATIDSGSGTATDPWTIITP